MKKIKYCKCTSNSNKNINSSFNIAISPMQLLVLRSSKREIPVLSSLRNT